MTDDNGTVEECCSSASAYAEIAFHFGNTFTPAALKNAGMLPLERESEEPHLHAFWLIFCETRTNVTVNSAGSAKPPSEQFATFPEKVTCGPVNGMSYWLSQSLPLVICFDCRDTGSFRKSRGPPAQRGVGSSLWKGYPNFSGTHG